MAIVNVQLHVCWGHTKHRLADTAWHGGADIPSLVPCPPAWDDARTFWAFQRSVEKTQVFQRGNAPISLLGGSPACAMVGMTAKSLSMQLLSTPSSSMV